MDQSKRSSRANSNFLSTKSGDADSSDTFSFPEVNGSSNFLVSIDNSPAVSRGKTEEMANRNSSYAPEQRMDAVLSELMEQTINKPLDFGDITGEIGEMDSAQFGFRSPNEALRDPIDESQSFTIPETSADSTASRAFSRGILTKYFSEGSGPLGSLDGEFRKDEALPFSSYVRPRAPAFDVSVPSNGSTIPLVSFSSASSTPDTAETFRNCGLLKDNQASGDASRGNFSARDTISSRTGRVDSAPNGYRDESKPPASFDGIDDRTSIRSKVMTSNRWDLSATTVAEETVTAGEVNANVIRDASMATEICDTSCASDEGISERYFCEDGFDATPNRTEKSAHHMGNSARNDDFFRPTQSTPKHDREELVPDFVDNLSVIQNTFCGPTDVAGRIINGANSEKRSSAQPCQSSPRQSTHTEQTLKEPDGQAPTLSTAKCGNSGAPGGGQWHEVRDDAAKAQDNNSTMTQGSSSSNKSSETGAAYYNPNKNSEAPSLVYVPSKIELPSRCCVGIRAELMIPVMSHSDSWLHVTPTALRANINGVPVKDLSSAVVFAKHIVTVKPGGNTMLACHVLSDRTGKFSAIVELEIGEVIEGMPGHSKDASRRTRRPQRVLQKVELCANVDTPQVEIEPERFELVGENGYFDLGALPTRCAVSEALILRNGSNFVVPVKVRLEGEPAVTKLFQLDPCNRHPTDPKYKTPCSNFTTDLNVGEDHSFFLFFKAPAALKYEDGNNNPVTVVVNLVVELNGADNSSRRLSSRSIFCLLGSARPICSLADRILRVPCGETRAFSISNSGNIPLQLAIEVESSSGGSSDGSSGAWSSAASQTSSSTRTGTGAGGNGAYAAKGDHSCFLVVPDKLHLLPDEGKCVHVSFHPPPSYSSDGGEEVLSTLHMTVVPNGEAFNVSLRGLPHPRSSRTSFASGTGSTDCYARIPAGRDPALLRKDVDVFRGGSAASDAGSGRSKKAYSDAMTSPLPSSTLKTASSSSASVAAKGRVLELRRVATRHLYVPDVAVLENCPKGARREVKISSATEHIWFGVCSDAYAEGNLSKFKIANFSTRDSILLELSLKGSSCDFFFASDSGDKCASEPQCLYLPANSSFMLPLYCRIHQVADVPVFAGELKMKTLNSDMTGRQRKFTIKLRAFRVARPLLVLDYANEPVNEVLLDFDEHDDLRGSFFVQNPNEFEHCFVFSSISSWEQAKVEPDCYLLSPKEIKVFYVKAAARTLPPNSNSYGSLVLLSGLESLRRVAMESKCALVYNGINLTQNRLRDHWAPQGGLQEALDKCGLVSDLKPEVLRKALMGSAHKRTLELVLSDGCNATLSNSTLLVPADSTSFFQSKESVFSPSVPPSSESFMDVTSNVTRELPRRSARTWDAHPLLLRFDTGQAMVKPVEVTNWTGQAIRVSVELPNDVGLVVRPTSGVIPANSSLKFLVDIGGLRAQRRGSSWTLGVRVGSEKKEVSVMVSPFVVPRNDDDDPFVVQRSPPLVADTLCSSDVSDFPSSVVSFSTTATTSTVGKTATIVLLDGGGACDFGECRLGSSNGRSVAFRCDGDGGGAVTWKLGSPKGYAEDARELAFKIRPLAGSLSPGDTAEVTVTFEPIRAISYASTWTLCWKCPGGRINSTEIRLTGRGRDVRQALPSLEPAVAESSVGPGPPSTSSASVSGRGGASSEGGSTTSRFQDVSVGSVKSPSSDSTLLGFDRNLVEFPTVTLGRSVLPISTKLRLTNYSSTKFKLEGEAIDAPFSMRGVPAEMPPRRYESFTVLFNPKKKGVFRSTWTLKPVGRSDIAPLRVELFGRAD